MARRESVLWALLATLGACAESSDEPQIKAAPKLEEAPIPISVKASECTGSQTILPISGDCDTGLPALYSDMDATAPLAFSKCVWKTFEAQLSPESAVRFRLQDCSNDPLADAGMNPIRVVAEDRTLAVALGDGSNAIPFLRSYDLHGADGMHFLERRRAALPPHERARCVVRPHEASDFTSANRWANLYEIAPNPEYMREIMAISEKDSACGEQGWRRNGARYWELRDGEAWFWDIADETPVYDPRSFTTLQKQGAGAWDLAAMKPVGLAN